MAIIITKKGAEILVDDEDYAELSAHSWHLSPCGYVLRHKYIDGERHKIWMHRLLMGLVRDDVHEVDHINGSKIDNRRSNLRLSTRAQNEHNKGLRKNNTSGYKGVFMSRSGTSWYARIKLDYVARHLGTFGTPDEAAHAYNKAAIALHGEFAVLNPVGGIYVE